MITDTEVSDISSLSRLEKRCRKNVIVSSTRSNAPPHMHERGVGGN